MKKFKYVLFTMMAIAISTVATMAQAGAGGYNESYVSGNKALGAGIGFGLAPASQVRSGLVVPRPPRCARTPVMPVPFRSMMTSLSR